MKYFKESGKGFWMYGGHPLRTNRSGECETMCDAVKKYAKEYAEEYVKEYAKEYAEEYANENTLENVKNLMRSAQVSLNQSIQMLGLKESTRDYEVSRLQK